MTARRLAALRAILALAHVVLGLTLLLPVAVIVGIGSVQALSRLPFSLVLVGITITAFPMGLLLCGLRMFWQLTPRLIRTLLIMDSIVAVFALLLCIYGLLAFRAAEQSAARGGGLLGAYGVIPITLGLVIGSLAGTALWLLCRTSRRLQDRDRTPTI